jgi:hypothetical protein
MLYFLYDESGYRDPATFLKESGEKDTPFADRLVARPQATPHLSERSGADRPSTAVELRHQQAQRMNSRNIACHTR